MTTVSSIENPNFTTIQYLEKKAIDNLSKPANNHGISLISSIAFLTFAIISSAMQLPIVITIALFSVCIISSIFTIRFYKILQKEIQNIVDEKNAFNIQNWEIKKANIFSYYILDFKYKTN